MERKTRIPTQKRALEKYNRILEAAYKLFNEKGYYNTTTADISKEADVAIGSVYAYFEDKKDILLPGSGTECFSSFLACDKGKRVAIVVLSNYRLGINGDGKIEFV